LSIILELRSEALTAGVLKQFLPAAPPDGHEVSAHHNNRARGLVSRSRDLAEKPVSRGARGRESCRMTGRRRSARAARSKPRRVIRHVRNGRKTPAQSTKPPVGQISADLQKRRVKQKFAKIKNISLLQKHETGYISSHPVLPNRGVGRRHDEGRVAVDA
jgi:hypothetical protein